MLRNFLLIAVISIFFTNYILYAVDDITEIELKKHTEQLASEEFQGRKPGTPGGKLAAEYIKKHFNEIGLKAIGQDFFQSFNIVTEVKTGNNNTFSFDGFTGKLDEDFVPFSFSKNASVKAELVFAGYGFDIDSEKLKWNDYENINVKGKWVLILRGDPEIDSTESIYIQHSDLRGKVLTASDQGALGVIIVSSETMNDKDLLVPLSFDKSKSSAGIPVINITRKIADQILSKSSNTINALAEKLNETRKPNSFDIPIVIEASADVVQTMVQTENVVGMVIGSDPVLKEEYIVIGAHYDHLGYGGPNSGSRNPDTSAVHHGADDNASGVSGIIEIAEKTVSNNSSIKRSIIFIAFTAEEMGLLGSKYFTNNSLVEINKIKAMINFDMIGRLDDKTRKLIVQGTGTSIEAEQIISKLSEVHKLDLAMSPGGFGPSDHAAFYSEKIPVFFMTTGAHEDYHLPEDDIDKINTNGQKSIANFAYDLMYELANRQYCLTYKSIGTKRRVKSGKRSKITLGIMPDFASAPDEGLGVGGVTPGGPAEIGGMLKGDVIVALEGKSVKNIYDYMNRTKKLKAGQTITVDVVRDGIKKVFLIQL